MAVWFTFIVKRYRKMGCLHEPFPPDKPLWCIPHQNQLHTYNIECCRSYDYCNADLKPTLSPAPQKGRGIGLPANSLYLMTCPAAALHINQGWVQVAGGKSSPSHLVAWKVDGKSKSKSKSFYKI